MSFQNLRAGGALYILYKEQHPRLEIGQVVSVSNPMPKYPMNGVPNYPMMNQEMVVDVSVKVGDQTFNYQKLPANLDIQDLGNNSVIACTREAILYEVTAFKQASQEALSRVEYHKDVIAGCDKIVVELNPEIAEREKMAKENKELRQEVADLKNMFAEFLKSQKANSAGSSNNPKSNKQ